MKTPLLQDDGTVTKYYQAFGRSVAMRTEDAAAGMPETGADCANTADDDSDTIVNDGCPMYLLADHLGGTTHVLDSSGAVLSEQKYWPYGGLRDGGISETDKLFTGQQDEPGDSALGLYNYKARFYSTTLGRFVSADPTSHGGLNRFPYSLNNPVTFSDPSGFDPTQDDLDKCASDLLSCLTFSFAAKYGVTDIGLIIVGGRGQTGARSIGSYEYLIKEFFGLTLNCASTVDECYGDLATLISQRGGYDAAYSIFGIRFIPTDLGDAGAWLGRDTDASDALARALADSGKRILGVVGFSLGANVVLQFFLTHQQVNVAFYAVEPFPPWDSKDLCEEGIRQCAGLIPFDLDVDIDVDVGLEWPPVNVRVDIGHSRHNDPETASDILSKVVAGTVDLARGAR